MRSQNTSYHVLVYLEAERQRNLLRDSWTSPGGIVPFQLDDSLDKVSGGSLWTGLMPGAWGKKEAVFPILQYLVEAQKGGWLQDDRGTDQTSGAYQERAEPGDEPIGYS